MTTFVDNPGHGLGFRIQTVWAAVAAHGDQDEGVMALFHDGKWTPLIAADPERLEWVIQSARRAAKLGNVPVRLVRFDTRTLVETFYPDGRRERPG